MESMQAQRESVRGPSLGAAASSFPMNTGLGCLEDPFAGLWRWAGLGAKSQLITYLLAL